MVLKFYPCISKKLISCVSILLFLSCGTIEGEKLVIPRGKNVPVMSTEEPWQICLTYRSKDDIITFACEKRTENEEQRKNTYSRAEGKVGDILVFGRTTTYFEYDEYNRRTASTKGVTYLRAKFVDYDYDNDVATIVILPKDFQYE